MKKIFYSKNLNDLSTIKKSFLLENQRHLKNTLQINKLYKKNKKRLNCKNCEKKLNKKLFKSFAINYYYCENCNHLNGGYQEDKKFLKKIYNEKKGQNYAINYLKNYNSRLKNIYIPKIEFYKKILKKKSFIEIGSGLGYLLKAAEKKNIKAIGYETNKIMVTKGKKKLKKNYLMHCDLENIENIILNSRKECLVLIGVLEHLENPNEILRCFKISKLKYLYLSLPLFSLSSIIENIFTKIYPRQLGGAHTHLYTKNSINYFVNKFKFKIIGEWWFGQDFLDLSRSFLNSSNIDQKNEKHYHNLVNIYFRNHLNNFQSILDKNKICSEVHLIIKK